MGPKKQAAWWRADSLKGWEAGIKKLSIGREEACCPLRAGRPLIAEEITVWRHVFTCSRTY